MGKTEAEQELGVVPASPEPALENADRRCPPCRSVGRIVSLRCMVALLVGVAVLLSAVFWLPPFFRHGSGGGFPDLDDQYGADIVASFKLQKPIALLNANTIRLQYDIFHEIGVPNTTVAVIDMVPLDINSTNVVFGMWPYPRNSNITTGLSILKSSFVSLVLRQSTLHLMGPLFGSSYFFQILKFPGGITIVPPQSAFLLQKERMIFNFSLNFPIYQVQDKIEELKEQMKLGLHLTSYEILFVRLTNMKGSTMSPPTVVETSIVFAVGNNLPTVPRLKQLAQNIRNSSAGNLGLNHTTFGRVKQIRLSSFLQHSLSSGYGSSLSPTPAPQPTPAPHHHHHSHSHHSRHHSDIHPSPAPSPSPSPKSAVTQLAPSPSSCRFRVPTTPKSIHPTVPAAAPAIPPHVYASSPSKASPVPSPNLPPPPSHVPAASFTRARSPNVQPKYSAPSTSPLPSPSFRTRQRKLLWVFLFLLHLWL